MKFTVRVLVNAVALYLAARFVQGISMDGGWLNLLLVALVFGLINALVRPIAVVLSCPLMIVTLGLFTLVLNALMLLLTDVVSRALGLGFSVEGFVPALLGSIVVSIVSIILSMFLGDSKRREEQRYR